MKFSIRFAALVMGIALLTAGCGKSAQLDTSNLSSSFQSEPSERKGNVDDAISAIGSGDFGAASESLKKAVKGAQLNPEQKAAVSEAVAEMQKIASQDSDTYPLEVYYAIGEGITVMEGLPVIKRPTLAPQ